MAFLLSSVLTRSIRRLHEESKAGFNAISASDLDSYHVINGRTLQCGANQLLLMLVVSCLGSFDLLAAGNERGTELNASLSAVITLGVGGVVACSMGVPCNKKRSFHRSWGYIHL